MKTPLPLTLIDRFHPHQRNEQQEAINNGHIRKLEEIELLEPEQLRPLALLSLLLLIIGAIFFGLLNYISYTQQAHSTTVINGFKGLLLWVGINIIGYILILPIHELIHAAAFVLCGGKPYFGAKLPYGTLLRRQKPTFPPQPILRRRPGPPDSHHPCRHHFHTHLSSAHLLHPLRTHRQFLRSSRRYLGSEKVITKASYHTGGRYGIRLPSLGTD